MRKLILLTVLLLILGVPVFAQNQTQSIGNFGRFEVVYSQSGNEGCIFVLATSEDLDTANTCFHVPNGVTVRIDNLSTDVQLDNYGIIVVRFIVVRDSNMLTVRPDFTEGFSLSRPGQSVGAALDKLIDYLSRLLSVRDIRITITVPKDPNVKGSPSISKYEVPLIN